MEVLWDLTGFSWISKTIFNGKSPFSTGCNGGLKGFNGVYIMGFYEILVGFL